MKKYCVYCHTNKQNNKKYVGITCDKPEKRWKNGLGYKHNDYFFNAILKYGWQGFIHDILYLDLDKIEAENIEKQLIKQWELTNRSYGYNIEGGGNLGKEVSEETRLKLSEATKKQMTREAREHLRQCTLKQFAEKGHPTLGHKCSDDKKEKIKKSHAFHAKEIEQWDFDGNLINVFPSLHELERQTGFFRSAIINYLNGKSNYCYGFIWKRREKGTDDR